MTVATQKIRALAQTLISLESNQRGASTSRAEGPATAIEKLRPHLTNLMGNVGFVTLLARALVLASTEVIWLRTVRLSEEGTWEGLAEAQTQISASDFTDALVLVLAQLLGLLVALVGEALMVRLVSEVWPNLSLKNLNTGRKDKNEKNK